MQVTPDGPPWSSEDADVFRQFLNTQTGSRLIPKLAEFTPSLRSKGETNDILIRNGEVRGVQIILRLLMSLAYPEPENVNSADNNHYPSLTDDRAWDDGKKIEIPQQ